MLAGLVPSDVDSFTADLRTQWAVDDLDPRRVWLTATRGVPQLRAYLIDTVIPGLDH